MKTILIVYGISWLILLVVYLSSLAKKKSRPSNPFKTKDPWYLYALMIAAAPFVVLIIPFILIDDKKKEKAQKKRSLDREEQKRKEELIKKNAEVEYNSSLPLKEYGSLIECVLKGKEVVELAEAKKYDGLFKKLDAINLGEGLCLKVQKCKEEWPGDSSKLYVTDSKESRDRDYDIFKRLKVEDSYNGAWQAYLLFTLWHILPHFQHGCYAYRTPIFDKNDIHNIRLDDDRLDLNNTNIKDENNFYPIISKSKNNYFVSACYWSDWSGLVRELVEITIKDNMVVNIFGVSNEIKYKYDCGIMF